MGQKDGDDLGTLGLATAGNVDVQELDIVARLAIVQARLDGDGETNPNLVDTPDKWYRHGYDFAKAA
jgi:hypothetical protein